MDSFSFFASSMPSDEMVFEKDGVKLALSRETEKESLDQFSIINSTNIVSINFHGIFYDRPLTRLALHNSRYRASMDIYIYSSIYIRKPEN